MMQSKAFYTKFVRGDDMMKTDDPLVMISRIYPEGRDEKGFFTLCGGIECPRVMHLSEFKELVKKRKIRRKDYLVEYLDSDD